MAYVDSMIKGPEIASHSCSYGCACEFDCDIDKRTGHFTIGDVMQMSLAPIRSHVTGADRCAQIQLPNGFEFREAEMASVRFTAQGPELELEFEFEFEFQSNDVCGFLACVGYGPYGVIA